MNSNNVKNENNESLDNLEEDKFEVINTNSKEGSQDLEKPNDNWEKVGGSGNSKESLESPPEETENELVNVKPSSKGNIVSEQNINFDIDDLQENIDDTLAINDTINVNEEKSNYFYPFF